MCGKSFILCLLSALQLNTYAQNLTDIDFTVERASDWTNLFQRTDGWFGGDGIYSIPLNGNEHHSSSTKTLFIFSDSMIGKLKDKKTVPGSKMINNAVAILDNNKPKDDELHFHWNTTPNEDAKSVFTPQTPNTTPKDYYWLGDGFVNQEKNNSIFLFAYRIQQRGSGAFGFEEVGNTLIKIKANDSPPFKNYTQKDTPFYIAKESGESGSFGAGVYVNTKKSGARDPDGYIYIYGVKGMTKKLLVARVKPKDIEDYTKWTFWDGRMWQSDMHQSASITDQVSNELSVSALPDGRYALIFQHNGIGKHVSMRIGSSPFGPFGPIINIWDCSEDLERKGYFAYNAKAHPHLSAAGELLISYNINSQDFFEDLGHDPQFYRPRFIKVKFK